MADPIGHLHIFLTCLNGMYLNFDFRLLIGNITFYTQLLQVNIADEISSKFSMTIDIGTFEKMCAYYLFK